MKRSVQENNLNADDRRVSFNNDTEIRYRTASEDSSTSTYRSKKLKNLDSGFNNYNNNKSYANINSDTNKCKKKTERENKFDMLLSGRCSWSYKSLKADGSSKKDTNSFLSGKSPPKRRSVSTNSPKVYNFEDHFGSEKDDPCYDFNELNTSKRTKKGRKKNSKSNDIPTLCESPAITSKALRNKKRINYADWEDEFDFNIDKIKDSTMRTRTKSPRIHRDSTSRQSECSEDEGLVFQTRFSDKNANLLEIANSIESDSNDLFENLRETDRTTTSPTILKLTKNLTSKPTEQTSSDNLIGESLQVNKVLEKSESIQSESENSFSFSPEEGNAETDRKCPEFNIDISADIFEKCQKVCSDLHAKYNDFELEKTFDGLKEITVEDTNRTEINAMSGSYQSEEVSENKFSSKDTLDKKDNEILSKNKKKKSIKNKFDKKCVDQILEMSTSTSISDFNEERLEIKMDKSNHSDSGSETAADNEKGEIIEIDLGSEKSSEIEENVPVKDLVEWQSSNEEENTENQNTLKKEMFFKKMESSLNWDTTLDTEMECISDISPSYFNQRETKLKNLPEKTLSVNSSSSISKTNLSALKYYSNESPSHSTDAVSESEGRNFTFQAQRFEKMKDITPNKDSLSVNENSNIIGKRRDSFTHKQEKFLKKEGNNRKLNPKQINERKNVRKGKAREANQEKSSFNISIDANFLKSKVRSTKKTPKTWEDLQTTLLSETENSFCKISSKSYSETSSRDTLWNQKITKGFFQTGSKETKKVLCLQESQHINSDSNQVLPNSPNINIINKAIQAMEKCTTRYVSPFEKDFISNLKEYEENDALNEYSISVQSTIIHSSKNKLSATNTFFQSTGKINNVKKGKKVLKNKITKDSVIGKNTNLKTKTNVSKKGKLANSSKMPKNTMHKHHQDASGNCAKCNFDIDENSYSNTEDICTVYNSTVLPYGINFDKSRQSFHLNEAEVESRYSLRKRKVKPAIENQCKKFKTELIPQVVTLQNSSDEDVANDSNPLIKLHTKNNFDSTKTDLAKELKNGPGSGKDSNVSFNHTNEIIGQFESSDFESNVVKGKHVKVKPLTKKQNANLNIQSSSNLEAKVNIDNNHKNPIIDKNLKSKDETHPVADNKCMTESDINLVPENGKIKIKQTKKQNNTEKYKEYLKKLFQSENASLDNIENDEDKSIKHDAPMMKDDDDLFSISSEDSEFDENGVFSEANLTQNYGLFFDVLSKNED